MPWEDAHRIEGDRERAGLENTMTNQDEFPATATAYEQAYHFLRERIRDGRFGGGDRIKAEDIAVQLGVSRMPVREAIRQLDSEGLLTIRPNRGAVVTRLSRDEVRELFEMRAVLEGLVMRRAVERFDEDSFDELELRLVRLGRAGNDPDQWIERHSDFHDYICLRSGSQRLFAEVQRLRTAVEPYLRMTLVTPLAGGAVAEHRKLIDALRSGDPQSAENTMRDHVLSTAHDIWHDWDSRIRPLQNTSADPSP